MIFISSALRLTPTKREDRSNLRVDDFRSKEREQQWLTSLPQT